MERTKANNQYFGKAFEILVVETLTGKTPENSVLEKFSDLSEIRADVNNFLTTFGNHKNVEWCGNHTKSAVCDLIADGKHIELKYTSSGNGTYYNTTIYQMIEYGFDYRDYMNYFALYEGIATIPNISINKKAGSPVSVEDSLYIRNNFPNEYDFISGIEKRCREKFVNDLFDYFSQNFNVFIDFLNKMLRKETKNGLPDTIYIYNYKKKETKVLEIDKILTISQHLELKKTTNSLKYGNIRIAFGWQNGNGLNNPTIRIFID